MSLGLALFCAVLAAASLPESALLSGSWARSLSNLTSWPLLVAGISLCFASLAALCLVSPSAARWVSLVGVSCASLAALGEAVLAFSTIPKVGYPVLWQASAFHNLPLLLALVGSWYLWWRWRQTATFRHVLLTWWLFFVVLSAPIPSLVFMAF
jgi:hypothetical protein